MKVTLDEEKKNPILIRMGSDDDVEGDGGVATAVRNKVKRPKMYKVLLHNDDYSTMEFVIYVLKKYFGKSIGEAQKVMLQIHNEGIGLCGVYTFEIAETKVAHVTKDAKTNGHPLLCTCEID